MSTKMYGNIDGEETRMDRYRRWQIEQDRRRTHYKITGPNGEAIHGGDFVYDLPRDGKFGEWTPEIDQCAICMSGYHTTWEPGRWMVLGARVWKAHRKGIVDVDWLDKKTVSKQIRLVAERPDLVPQWSIDGYEYLKGFSSISLGSATVDSMAQLNIPIRISRYSDDEMTASKHLQGSFSMMLHSKVGQAVRMYTDPIAEKLEMPAVYHPDDYWGPYYYGQHDVSRIAMLATLEHINDPGSTPKNTTRNASLFGDMYRALQAGLVVYGYDIDGTVVVANPDHVKVGV